MPKQPCVYVLASKRDGTLYVGVTSDLFIRIGTHKQGLIEGFTKRYGVHRPPRLFGARLRHDAGMTFAARYPRQSH